MVAFHNILWKCATYLQIERDVLQGAKKAVKAETVTGALDTLRTSMQAGANTFEETFGRAMTVIIFCSFESSIIHYTNFFILFSTEKCANFMAKTFASKNYNDILKGVYRKIITFHSQSNMVYKPSVIHSNKHS